MSKRRKNRPLVSRQQAEIDVRRLRGAAQTLQRSRSRDAPHDFLQIVYHIYHRWRARGSVGRHKSMLLRVTELDTRKSHHPFRVLMDAANGSLEAKTKSRWTRALEYAQSEDTKPDQLIEFFCTNGGIAGCARTASRELPKHLIKRNDWE
jgi:hypothetical protein